MTGGMSVLLKMCVGVVEGEYVLVGVLLSSHNGGSYLTKSYTVPPSVTDKGEGGWSMVCGGWCMVDSEPTGV